MLKWPQKHVEFYIISYIVAVSALCVIFYLSVYIYRRNRILAVAFLAIFSLIEVAALLGSYNFFSYFNIIPNYYALEFALQESYNTYILFKESIRWYHGILFILAGGN